MPWTYPGSLGYCTDSAANSSQLSWKRPRPSSVLATLRRTVTDRGLTARASRYLPSAGSSFPWAESSSPSEYAASSGALSLASGRSEAGCAWPDAAAVPPA